MSHQLTKAGRESDSSKWIKQLGVCYCPLPLARWEDEPASGRPGWLLTRCLRCYQPLAYRPVKVPGDGDA